MDQVIGLVTQYARKRYEDDVVDRLNFQYTSYFFALCALIIGYNTYFGTAITCWTPAEFRGGWAEYTRDYCLIENTYYIPIEESEMPTSSDREQQKLSYYQWVQFILVFFAFLHYLPYLFWHSTNWWSGLQVRGVVTTATHLNKIDEGKRKEGINKIADHLYHYVVYKSSRRVFNYIPSNIARNWVASVYLLTKFLFAVVIVIQLILIHYFLGFSWNDFFGLKIGFASDWINTGIFPRQTMCDFEVRNKGSIQQYSVQCILPLNMLNEKIFLALFYYLLFLFAVTVINWIRFFITLQKSSRFHFSSRMLTAGGFKPAPSTETIRSTEKRPLILERDERTNNYNKYLSLNPDLATVFHLISSNAGQTVTIDVMSALFEKLCKKSE